MVPVVDRGWVRAAPSHRLVPGDVIVLQRGRAPCDVVLLRGSCLVEESTLSGEVWVRGLGLRVYCSSAIMHPNVIAQNKFVWKAKVVIVCTQPMLESAVVLVYYQLSGSARLQLGLDCNPVV